MTLKVLNNAWEILEGWAYEPPYTRKNDVSGLLLTKHAISIHAKHELSLNQLVSQTNRDLVWTYLEPMWSLTWVFFESNHGFTQADHKLIWDFIQTDLKSTELLYWVELKNRCEDFIIWLFFTNPEGNLFFKWGSSQTKWRLDIKSLQKIFYWV